MEREWKHHDWRRLAGLLGLIAALSLPACNEEALLEIPEAELAGICEAGEIVSTEPSEDGVVGTCIDAVFEFGVDPDDDEDWVYVDLATMTEVTPETPDDSDDWDIAFQRSNIKLNGGANGTGNVAAAGLVVPDDTELGDVGAAPFLSTFEFHEDIENPEEEFSTGFVLTNLPGDPEADDFGWYHYDGVTHQLTARENVVYVIRSRAGDYYAFHMVGWKNEAGTSGYPHFYWKLLDDPELPCPLADAVDPPLILHTVNGDSTLTTCVNASSTEVTRHLDLETGNLVDPAASDAWDIGIRRYRVILNGGANSDGGGDAAMAAFEEGDMDFDSLSMAPGEGEDEGEMEYFQDTVEGVSDSNPFNSQPAYTDDPEVEGDTNFGWVVYALFGPGSIFTRDAVYIVRSADGAHYYKIQFVTYYRNSTAIFGGTSAYVTFHWAEIDPPPAAE
ncbi:MAG: HmuY family protein [Bdellovibrionota bacterium]